MERDVLETLEPTKLIESKKYEINYEEDSYSLLIETYSNETIFFQLRKANNLSLNQYTKTCTCNEMRRLFFLQREIYDKMETIFIFIDTTLTMKTLNLDYNEGENKMILKHTKKIDFKEVECILELYNDKIPKDEMFLSLIEEINNIKENKVDKNEKDIIINELRNKHLEYEEEIQNLKENIVKLEEEIIKHRQNEDNLKEKIEKLEEEIILHKQNEDKIIQDIYNLKYKDFKENPLKLKFKKELANNRDNSGHLCNFDIFIGLKDNIEYLIYSSNYILKIMRICDKRIIKSLGGHFAPTTVIRYYMKNNNEDYILSSDKNNKVIIWDIQNNYNQKYILEGRNSYQIWDALLLFNINNRDYIALSNDDKNEYSKLYELNNNAQFIKNIDNTKENKTDYMIPWTYNNKYYIIELCYGKISINNIFDDENYAELSSQPEGYQYCGYIYNQNFLCVSDRDNSLIRIWDLVNKSIYKEINYDGIGGYGIIPWNQAYTIVACETYFIVIDIEEEKMLKRILYDDDEVKVKNIKKIKISNLGECLICSSEGNKIKLFNI